MLILDTDQVTHLMWAESPKGQQLADRISEAGESVVATVVSYEEHMRGWLARLKKAAKLLEEIEIYRRLTAAIKYYCDMFLLPFDEVAATRFQELRKQYRRLGTMDLKIAAIALTRNATLISANLRDFKQIEGLTVEDWTT